jgi:uncharacterized protein (TIGR02145 family)
MIVIKQTFFSILIILASLEVYSQTYYYCIGDSVYLGLDGYNGSLQWQQSSDSVNWTNISGANYSPFGLIFWGNKFYRAMVTNSGCNTIYSSIKNVIENNVGCPAPIYPPGSVFCSGVTAIVPVVNPVTGRVWMDRNLGASQVAISSTDVNSYGFLYQWGRRSDGHQCRTSLSTDIISSIDQPQNGLFIMCNGVNNTNDWRNPQNSNLWQGVGGINNPCPTGYRLPTGPEFNAEISTWSILNSNGAYQSILKLPLGGMRGYVDGSGDPILNAGTQGYYWTSTTFNDVLNFNEISDHVRFTTTQVTLNSGTASSGNRARGMSIRCIKN